MTFLPIVERELRVAVRRKATYRVRLWTALIAVMVAFVSAPIVWLSAGTFRGAGAWLFSVLSGYAFFLCSIAGMFLTAGALAEEKSNGTLGLLFLTDLKGYDVVIGKFIGRAINPFFAVFALVPVTAFPLLLGGVTGVEVWRTTLALVNGLFVSLVIGVLASAICRDPRNAFGVTLLSVIVLFYLLPSMTGLPIGSKGTAILRAVCAISPGPPYVRATNVTYESWGFWIPLLLSHLFGWILLVIASGVLPALWQDRPVVRRNWLARAHITRPTHGSARRSRIVSRNPVCWLALAGMGSSGSIWLIVLLSGAVFLCLGAFSNPLRPNSLFWTAKVCGFVLKLSLAFEACRFFVDHRRSGALELLFSTPLRPREIINGQILALRHRFAAPMVIFLGLALIPVGWELIRTIHHQGLQGIGQQIFTFGSAGAMLLWFMVGFVADVCALACVGIWLALSMKKPSNAAMMTIFSVLIIPSIGFCFLDVVVDVFLIIWSVTNLRSDMRWILARQTETFRNG